MIQLKVNGTARQFDGDPEIPLLWFLRDILDMGIIRNLGNHDRKLIPAQPGNGIRLAHACTDAMCRLYQQHIAHCMTQRVIHFLELVEINQD